MYLQEAMPFPALKHFGTYKILTTKEGLSPSAIGPKCISAEYHINDATGEYSDTCLVSIVSTSYSKLHPKVIQLY